MTENKAFCILPFIHLHLDEFNNIKLCCVASRESFGNYTDDFDFNTNPELTKVRKLMLEGTRVNACTECYKLDDNSVESQRVRENRDWFKKLGINDIKDINTKLIYYDIRNDNLCNLSCRMCSPRSSSQLAKEYKEIGWPVPDTINHHGFDEIVDLDAAKMIYVSGGEPTIMPTFRKFLKKAINYGRQDLDIRLNTNATNFNLEFADLLKQFNHSEITVSIDGYKKVNKYIRWPSDWDTLTDNIKIIKEVTKYVSFNITVSIWNISNLSNLVFYLEDTITSPTILLNDLTYPKSLNFKTFPNKDLVINDIDKIVKQSYTYKNDQYFKSKIDYFYREIINASENVAALTEFFLFNDSLDRSRKIKLVDFIPELENCRNYYKNKTHG